MPRPERGVGQGTFCMPCSRGSLGGFGSTLSFFGDLVMAEPGLPPLPLPPDKWQEIAKQLGLSPRQIDVVELILRNQCGKQIEDALGMRHGTYRTQIERIFEKADVADQQELVVLLCALSHGIPVRLKTDSIETVSRPCSGQS
jgi:DNA-binding CsgD family transcriptional regulator